MVAKLWTEERGIIKKRLTVCLCGQMGKNKRWPKMNGKFMDKQTVLKDADVYEVSSLCNPILL